MDVPGSRQQAIIESIKKKIKQEPSMVAEHIGIPSGVVKRSAKQEREDYWTPDPNVMNNAQQFMEQAAQVAMQNAGPDEDPDTTLLRATGLFVHSLYPARLDLIRSGPRALSVKAQIEFADQMEKLGPPEPESE
jgi:hypothetical protein